MEQSVSCKTVQCAYDGVVEGRAVTFALLASPRQATSTHEWHLRRVLPAVWFKETACQSQCVIIKERWKTRVQGLE